MTTRSDRYYKKIYNIDSSLVFKIKIKWVIRNKDTDMLGNLEIVLKKIIS